MSTFETILQDQLNEGARIASASGDGISIGFANPKDAVESEMMKEALDQMRQGVTIATVTAANRG
jgi:polysaccharide deacetylase 2 family uncharacterized protein YibQ